MQVLLRALINSCNPGRRKKIASGGGGGGGSGGAAASPSASPTPAPDWAPCRFFICLARANLFRDAENQGYIPDPARPSMHSHLCFAPASWWAGGRRNSHEHTPLPGWRRLPKRRCIEKQPKKWAPSPCALSAPLPYQTVDHFRPTALSAYLSTLHLTFLVTTPNEKHHVSRRPHPDRGGHPGAVRYVWKPLAF